MLKATLRLGALVAVVLVGYPVVHYRALSPCEMLRQELAWQLEAKLELAATMAAEQLEALDGVGADAGVVSADVAAALEGVAAGITAGVAEAKVHAMSQGECVSELWRITIGGDDAFEDET